MGAALRTISLRIRGAKVELSELGEETDDMAVSTSKLREQLLALSGVDIMLDNNTFKSTYQILLEMSDAFRHMTDLEKAAAGELLAGKNRSNALYAILQNAEELEDVYQSAIDAQGSAMQENERFMQSINGHLQQLSNTWQKVWVDTINSDLVKGIIDLGNGILKVVDAAGGLDSILISIATTISLLNIEKIAKSIGTFATKFVEFLSSAKKGLDIITGFKEAKVATEGLTKATEASSVAARAAAYAEQLHAAGLISASDAAYYSANAEKADTTSLVANTAATEANAAAKLALKNVLALVAGAALLAGMAIYNAYKKEKQAQEDARQEAIQRSKDTIESFEEMQKAADHYKSVVGDHSHTEEELTSALEDVNSALGDKSDTLKALQDDEKAYQQELDKTIAKQKEEAQTAALIQKQKASRSIEENLGKLGEDSTTFSKPAGMSEETQSAIENVMGSRNMNIRNLSGDIGFNFSYDAKDAKDTLAYYDKLIELSKQLNEQNKEYTKIAAEKRKEADAAEAKGNEAYAEQLRAEAEVYDSYVKSIESFTDELTREITRVGDYAQAYSDALVSDVKLNYEAPTTFADYKKQLEDFIAAETGGKEVTQDIIDTLTQRFNQAFPQIVSDIDAVKSAIETLPSIDIPDLMNLGPGGDWDVEGLENYLDTLKNSKDPLDQYVTASDMALVSTEAFQNYLKENDIGIITGDYESLVNAVASYKESLEPVIDFQADFAESLRKSKDDIDNFQSSISSLSKIAENAFDGVTTGEEFVDGLQAVADAMEDLDGTDIDLSAIDSIEELGDAAQKVADRQLQKLLDKLKDRGASDALVNNIKRACQELMNYQTAIGSAVNGMSSLSSAYQTIRGAMDEYNESGELTFATLSSLLQLEPEYLSLLQVEGNQFSINQGALEALVEDKKADAIAATYAAEQAELDALAEKYAGEMAQASAQMHLAAAEANAVAAGSYWDVATAAQAAAQMEAIAAQTKALGVPGAEVDKVTKKYNDLRTAIGNVTVSSQKGADKVLGYTSKAAKGAGGAAKDAANDIKQQIDETLSKLKQAVEDGGITYKRYIQEARRITDQAYAQGKISAQDYHDYKMRLLREEMDMYRQVVSAVQDVLDQQKEGLQDQIDAIGDQKAALQEQIDGINEHYDALIKAEKEKIKQYEAEKEKLQEKIKKLENKQEKVREKYQPKIDKNDKQIKKYEEQIRPLQKIVDKHQDIIDSLNRQIEDLESVRTEYEYQISDIEKIKRANDRVINDLEYVQKQYEDQQKVLEKVIKAYERQKKLNDRKIKQLERQQKVYEKQQKSLQKQIKTIEKQQKLLEKMKNPYKDQIESLKKQKEQLQKVNEERNRALSLQKAQYELDKAQNQRTAYVYTNGGFEYRNDEESVKNAKENLEDVQLDIQVADIDDQIDAVQSAIDLIQDKIDNLQDHIDTLNDKIEELQTPIDEIQDRIDIWNDKNSELEQCIEDLNWDITNLQIPIDELQDQINALNRANDEWDYRISKIQLRIDDLDDAIEQLNRQIKRQEDLMRPYQRRIEDINKKIEKLEKANELLKEKMEDQIEVYQKQIDAIEKEISKYDDKIEKINKVIEKLEEERDAAVDAIEKQIKALDKQEAALNKQIKAIDRYAKEWEKLLKIFERMKNEKLLEDIFGPNWREMIENQSPEALSKMRDLITQNATELMNMSAAEADAAAKGDQLASSLDNSGGSAANAAGNYQKAASALGEGGGIHQQDFKQQMQNAGLNQYQHQQFYNEVFGGGGGSGLIGAANNANQALSTATKAADTAVTKASETSSSFDTTVGSAKQLAEKIDEIDTKTADAAKNAKTVQADFSDTSYKGQQAANDVAKASTDIATGSSQITTATTTLASSVNKNFTDIQNYANKTKQIINTAVQSIESSTRRLKSSEKLLSNILNMSEKVRTEVKKILDQTNKKVTETQKSVNKTLKKLNDDVKKAQQNTKKGVDQVKKLTSLTGGLSPAVKSIKNFISKYIQGSGGIIKKSEEAKKKVTDIFDHNKGLRQAINSIKKFISDYLKKLENESTRVREVIKRHWEGSALDNAKNNINELLNKLKELSEKSEEAKKYLDEVSSYDSSSFNTLIQSLDEIIKKATEAKQKLDEIPEKKTVTIEQKVESSSETNTGNAKGGRVDKYAKGGRVKKYNISGALNRIAQAAGEDTMIAVKEGEGIFTEKQTDDLEEFIKLTPELVSSSKTLSKFSKLFTGLATSSVNASFTQRQISSNLQLAGAGGGVIAANEVSNSNNVTLSIGDIHLNGVQNVEGLAMDIKNNLPNAILQVLGRH